jgi:subtilisin family serine protease
VLLPSIDKEHRATTQLWNGTSMSAGYVSGAVALFLEGRPQARPDEVAAWIKTSATRNVVEAARSPATWLLYVGPVEGRRAPSETRISQR